MADPAAAALDAGLALAPRTRAWAPALLALAVGLAALGALFRPEAAAALRVWQASTAYGHCFLVLPTAAWLAWDRRAALAGLAPRPRPIFAVLALPLAPVWLTAERLGIMEGRQFAALFLVWLLVLACLGPAICRAMAAPLGYLVFLVPSGAFLVPALQHFTAGFIGAGLYLLDIPHAVTATIIEIPEGRFMVEEACAGLRFLVAAIAFGALYACIIFSGAWRRAGFIAVCTVVPILANGLRALGIVVLGHLRGSAAAGAVDHVVYGWLFFSLVIGLLLLLGLPFRQPPAEPLPRAARPGAASRLRLAAATVIVLAAAGAGPALAAWLDAAAPADAAAADRIAARLRLPAGCTATPPQAGRRHLTCDGRPFDLAVQVFGRRAGPAALRAWKAADAPAALWLDGAPAQGGLALRLRLALNAVVAHPSVAALITVAGPPEAAALLKEIR